MVLTELDVAWLAGLLEGEGSFFVQKRARPRRDQARVYLSMTDLDVVQRAAALMGAPVIPRQARTPGWKDQYTVTVTSQRAIDVMQAVLPYLGARRSAKVKEINAMNLSHTTV